MIPIKICGITRLEDAQAASELGAWALGFNFYTGSPRYIAPPLASLIISQLPPTLITIGIFINEPLERILSLQQQIGLSFLQVYENYACPVEQKQRMIITVQPKNLADLPDLTALNDYAMTLIDAPLDSSCLKGGTGRLANWEVAKYLSHQVKLILAGGINEQNIITAADEIQPFALDICSSIESSAGKKDLKKMRALFQKVRNHG